MAETSEQSGKTLEMRVAELEDKLAQTQITEADLKAYHKVAAALAARCVSSATGAVNPTISSVAPISVIHQPCVIHINPIGIVSPIVNPIIQTCACGPCELTQSAFSPAQTGFDKLGK